jgi:hypothetical protein
MFYTHHHCRVAGCGSICDSGQGLRDHMAENHGEEVFRPSNPCPQNNCGEFFLTPGLLYSHLRVHGLQNLGFPCPRCDRSFTTNQKMAQHQVSCDARALGKYRCDLCDYNSPNKAQLEGHLKTNRHKKKAEVVETAAKGGGGAKKGPLDKFFTRK